MLPLLCPIDSVSTIVFKIKQCDSLSNQYLMPNLITDPSLALCSLIPSGFRAP